MARGMTTAALLIALSALGGCGDSGSDANNATSGVSHEPGGQTPRAVIERLAAAVDAQDVRGIAVLLDVDQADGQKAAGLLLKMNSLGEPMQAARQKFGDEPLQQAMGMGYIMLSSMSPEFHALAADGQAQIDGNTAKFAQSDQSPNAGRSSMSVDLVQRDGRWYLDMDTADMPRDMAKVESAVDTARTSLTEAVAQSTTAEEFAGAVQPIMMTFMQSLQP